MSRENAIQFIERTEKDSDLQARINKIKKGDWEAFCAIAREAGFDFTSQDFHGVLEEQRKKKPGVVEALFGTVEHDTPPGIRPKK
jgi:predicted ribosomally synthesized peptide with nif11-like leader